MVPLKSSRSMLIRNPRFAFPSKSPRFTPTMSTTMVASRNTVSIKPEIYATVRHGEVIMGPSEPYRKAINRGMKRQVSVSPCPRRVRYTVTATKLFYRVGTDCVFRRMDHKSWFEVRQSKHRTENCCGNRHTTMVHFESDSVWLAGW